MHDALVMQRLQRIGDPRAELRHLLRRQRQVLELRQQGLALEPLHHDVGLDREIAVGHVARHMRALEAAA